MRKKLLYLSLFASLGLFTVSQVSAQEFDYNSGLLATTQVSGTGGLTNSANPGITQNGITLSFDPDDLANSNNSLSVGTATGANSATFTRIQFNNGTRGFFIMVSPTAITRLALQYRGSTDTNAGAVLITYGSTKAAAVSTYTFPAVTGLAPGEINYINFPAVDDVRYIKIQRGGSALQLFRVAASTSSTTFNLPLDFISFTAKANTTGNSVDLNWRTTNEINTKEFIIEKRTDNTDFSNIGTLASKNTSGIHNYGFIDNDISSGNLYYRLKQVDFDGKFKYSDIVQVKIKSKLTLSAFPNPTTDALNLAFAPAKNNASLKVLNLSGQVVLEQVVSNGSSIATLNTASLNPSMYLLVYDNEGEQSSLKFVKK